VYFFFLAPSDEHVTEIDLGIQMIPKSSSPQLSAGIYLFYIFAGTIKEIPATCQQE